jgi:hypothetical protein
MGSSDNGTFLALGAMAILLLSAKVKGSASWAGLEESDPAQEISRQRVIDEILDRVQLEGRPRRIYRKQLEVMNLRDLSEVYDTVLDITQEVEFD